MIDDFNEDRTGWARFSDDRVMRYRLARSLTGDPLSIGHDGAVSAWSAGDGELVRVTFLMLNPSTANAFDLDPTVKRCRARAIDLGAHILEVVNLFAFRSPYPQDLRSRTHGNRGDDEVANQEILAACRGARYVIAAWGNHGELDRRAEVVSGILVRNRITLWHLGFTNSGAPKHPLARGKSSIPVDQKLERYTL